MAIQRPPSTSSITSASLAALQDRMAAELARHLSQHAGRLGWDAARVAGHQRERMRALLTHSLERSPFHARRLQGLDPSRFELSDLPRLPVMSKSQMMAEFDDVVTDAQLSRSLVEEHLAASNHEPSLLLGDYVCLASGGSSGLRGVFIQTLGEYADFVASVVRRGYARALAAAGPPPEGLVLGIVGAASPIHSSGFGAAVAAEPPVRLIPAPATLPLREIVGRLNAVQPPCLLGYASKLAELAQEQLAGRLTITPRSVTSMAEVVTAADRALIEQAFQVPVTDMFVSTEGLVGHSEPGGSVLSFASDTCLAELVDDDNNPVPDGEPSAKVLVTNLHNFTQPLLRYELTDRMTGHASTGAAGWLRASLDGRADEVFLYGGVAVHPHVIRSVLVGAAGVSEYQVRQSERGIYVACVTDGRLDPASLAARLEYALRQAGLSQPRVHIGLVEEIARDPRTAKARRFVPLPAS